MLEKTLFFIIFCLINKQKILNLNKKKKAFVIKEILSPHNKICFDKQFLFS